MCVCVVWCGCTYIEIAALDLVVWFCLSKRKEKEKGTDLVRKGNLTRPIPSLICVLVYVLWSW